MNLSISKSKEEPDDPALPSNDVCLPYIVGYEGGACEWSPVITTSDLRAARDYVKSAVVDDELSIRNEAGRCLNMLAAPRMTSHKNLRADEEDEVELTRIQVSKRSDDSTMDLSRRLERLTLRRTDGRIYLGDWLDVGVVPVLRTTEDACERFKLQNTNMDFLKDEEYRNTVINEIPVSRTKDDAYVSEWVCGSARRLYSKKEFTGLIQAYGRCFRVRKPRKEVRVGIAHSSGRAAGGGISGYFTLSLENLGLSGRAEQEVELQCQNTFRRIKVDFGYCRLLETVGDGELVELFLEHKNVPLRELLPRLMAVSQPGSIQEVCLKFLSFKMSLLFGEGAISPYDIGTSLLFYSLIFDTVPLVRSINKMVDYIEWSLCEGSLCPSRCSSFLFLHETGIFLNRLTCIKARHEIGRARTDEREMYERMKMAVFNMCVDSVRDDGAIYRPLSYSDRLREAVRIAIVRSSMPERLNEAVVNFRTKRLFGKSMAYSHLLGLNIKLVELWNRGVSNCISGRELEIAITSMLSRHRLLEKEVLSACTIIRNMAQIVPMRVTCLDKQLALCIERAILVLSRRIKGCYKKKEDLALVFGEALRFYRDIHYLESPIHEKLFKFELHRCLEEESIHRLGKIPLSNTKEALGQLRICRSVHNKHQELLFNMEYQVHSEYRKEEKKAFMRLYDLRKIKEALADPKELERAIIQMIGKGIVVDDEIRRQYKIYLYEAIKDIARETLGERFNKTMLVIDKYFY
jgi:hypothetical protein